MVEKVIAAVSSKIVGLRQAAFLLSIFSFLSLLLGFTRDRILAHYFGAGVELDIYYAAFKIPDLIFVTVASLVSISALVPLFARRETEGEKHLKEAADSIFTVFSVIIVASCVLTWFIIPRLVPAVFGTLDFSAQKEVIFLSRILLLSPLLLGFSNFFGSIVQYENRFILYSLSPLLYNIGIIGALLFFVESLGVRAAVVGVCIGAFLHLLLQATFVFGLNRRPKLVAKIKWSDVWETARLSIPRTLALSITSFVSFLFVALAARLEGGSIAIFNLAYNLQSIPLSLVGVSFSLAAFPALAVSAARNNIEEIISRISDGLRQIIFWSLPITALIIILRAHIVRVVLGSGVFDWSATRLTAAVLALFVVSAIFQSIQLFLSRSLYALGKTKWPLLANISGGVAAVFFALYFMNNFPDAVFFNSIANTLNIAHLPSKILTLPLAFSIGSLTSALLLFFALGVRLFGRVFGNIIASIAASFMAAVITGFGAYFSLRLLDSFFDLNTFWGVLGHGALAGIGGILAGAIALYTLKSRELKEIMQSINTKVKNEQY